MSEYSTVDFLHRGSGESAAVIGGGDARPDHAERVSLKTADGGVLVKSVWREADGTFVGEVFGVTPQQRRLAVGDRVRFAESQIFAFKPRAAQAADAAEAGPADMIRAFEEGFGAGPASSASHFRHAPRAPAAGEATAPLMQQPPTAPAAAEPELTVDEAYAALGTAPEKKANVAEPRVEPVMSPPAPVAPPVEKRSVHCVECGDVLTYTPGGDAEAEAQRRKTVSCPRCGRINAAP